MGYPEGFKELVALVSKDKVPVAKGKDIWDKFCRAAFIGKGRSDAEISFLIKILKKQLDYDYMLKTSGEDWRNEIESLLKERLSRIQDEDIQILFQGLLKDLFYLTATLKGGARFFERKKIFDEIDNLTKTKDLTNDLIEEIVEDKDFSGMRYAKTIIWLQSTGRAKDFAPPTRHLKSFLNSDVGPYYSYYEDDAYFMKKAKEIEKDFPKNSLMDIYRTIFFYRTLKSIFPRGNKFTPKKLLEFMKKKKITVKKLSEMLSDMDEREELSEQLLKFSGYADR